MDSLALGEVLEEFDEKLGSRPEPTVLTLTEKNGFVSQEERFNKRLATEDTSGYKVVHRYDIAFNPYLLWAGAIAQNIDWDEGIISPAYPTFKVKDGFDPRYVNYRIHSEPMRLRYDVISFGAVPRRRRAATDRFLELDAGAFPNLKEQRRISAILDTAHAILLKRQQAIQLADEFLRTVFLDMFGDPGINPKNWPMGTIRDLAGDVRYGSSSKAGAKGEFPILRMNNITYTGSWNFGDLKYIDLSKKDQSKYLVHQGELLFNRTNSKELVGKTAVYREVTSMAFAGYLIRVRTNELANPEYISAYLNSRHGKLTLESMCKSIVGMANINAQEMQDIKIAIPPRKLQDRYAGIVHRTLKHRSKHVLADNSANKLFGSLSQRAFLGDL